MSFPSRASILRRCGLALFVLFLPNVARAQYCKPDFGERMLEWANGGAATQSRALAEADYSLRIFNYMLMTFDDANARMEQAAAALDAIGSTIRAQEAQVETDAVLAAVRRERNAVALQNDLFKVRTLLDGVVADHQKMLEEPTQSRFILEGLHNVGRATLFASFQEIGNAADISLAGRYGVLVQTTHSESTGEFETEVRSTGYSGDMYDSLAQLAVYYSGPYGGAVAYAYFIARTEYDSHVCRNRMREQKELLKRAMKALPERIIQPGEQFALYVRLYGERKKDFAEHSDKLKKANAAADQRWQDLFAANAMRSGAANAVLTSAKVEALQRRFGHYDRVTAMFQAMGHAEVHEATKELHEYVVTRQTGLLTACGDVNGFVAVEDQRDALAYAAASYRAFQKQAAFAPLNAVFSHRLKAVEETARELEGISRTLSEVRCPTLFGAGNESATTRPKYRSARSAALAQAKGALASKSSKGVTAKLKSLVAPQVSAFCLLRTRNGQNYLCGGDGSPYSEQFADNAGSPRHAVLAGAFDGGFARDVRAVSAKVQDAIQNINARISHLQVSAQGPIAALPAWRASNASVLGALEQRHANERARERREAANFQTAHAAEVSAARAYVDDFLRAPADASSAVALLRSMNAADLSLPDLPRAAVPPDAPALPGVTAARRAYGGVSDPQRQAIERERLKTQEQLQAHPALRAVAERAHREAERFAGRNGGERVLDELLKDSAAVRYFASGARSRLELAAVDSYGDWSRVEVADPDNLPSQTILAQAETFQRGVTGYTAKAGVVRGSLGAGDSSAPMRARVLTTSDQLAGAASGAFYSGELGIGRELLNYARTFLDIALGATPFVGTFKDAYEAYSGLHLVTGAQLSPSDRALAAVGFGAGLLTGGTLGGVARALPELLPFARELATAVPRYLEAGQRLGLRGAQELREFAEYARTTVGNQHGGAQFVDLLPGYQKVQRFGPLDGGPLRDIPLGPASVADTFRSSSYFRTVLDEGVRLYRVYDPSTAQLGRFWSRVPPTGPLQATYDAALSPQYGNSARYWVEIQVPRGQVLYEGIAAEVDIPGGKLLGGGGQVFLPEVPVSWRVTWGKFD